MAQFEITPQLKDLINRSTLPKESKTELLNNTSISRSNLTIFYQTCHPTSTLLELLATTKLHIQSIPDTILHQQQHQKLKQKTPEFIEQMETLRLRAKEEEYQRLVNPTPEYDTLYETRFDETTQLTPAQAHKELKGQLTTIVNIMISVASVSYAIWYWTETSWKLPDSYRVLLSLFFGLIVLVAEVVVYMSYLNKVEEAKIKERTKKEVKKVVDTINL